MAQENTYEFKYEGQNLVDLSTLITSQFHFLAMVDEIQRQYYPEATLKIKVGGFSQGSFIVDLLMVTTWMDHLFNKDNVDMVKNIVGILAGVLTVKSLLGGEKPEKIEEKGNNYEITTADNATIIVDQRSFNIYRDNQKLNRAIEENFELLENDHEIKGVAIKAKDGEESEAPTIKINNRDFHRLTNPNQYFDSDLTDERYLNEVLFIKKPNLLPEKGRVWKWEVLHKGRDIKVNVEDWNFAAKINEGLIRFGQGDRIIVDLLVGMKFDKTFNTYIESGKFKVLKVHEYIQRDEQTRLKLD